MIRGRIAFINEPCIQYRRHGENKTGSYSIKLNPFNVFKRFFLQFDDLAKTHARVYYQTLQTINQMHLNGIADDRIDDVEDAILSGGIKGCAILRKYQVKRKQKLRTLGIYFVMLTEKYKSYLNIH